MILYGANVYVRPFQPDDAEDLYQLRLRNRTFLQPWEPTQSDEQFTRAAQQEAITKALANWQAGTAYGFGIFLNNGGHLIGRVNLSNVVRGAWESCTIGYFLDQAMNGRGYMTEAVGLVVAGAFTQLGLHRVQAAVMPRNAASVRVVEKVGFRYEGLAEYYLKINGKWEDHNIYSMTVEHWNATLRGTTITGHCSGNTGD
ncbi:putative ribosomal-protein-alanine acetyltransferase [Alicyclobacillus contaminans]|nr:putative ribosomal-protein-alanine acetyltransferase [Alicyclobacillus contaminans]